MEATQVQYKDYNKGITHKILFGILGFDVAIITIVLIFLSIRMLKENEICAGNAILTFLITAMACLIGGIIIGFLFSIPRYNKDGEIQTNSPNSEKRTSYYKENTNLEDISDWLTKIIVGISLVQYNAILNKIESASQSLSEAICCNNNLLSAYYSFSYSSILFFSFSGFGVGYIWTRIVFTRMLYENQIDIIDEFKKIATSATAALAKKDISASNSAFSALDLTQQETIQTIPKESIDQLQKLQVKVKEIIKSKAIYIEDDLQKGRWGGKSENNDKIMSAFVTKSNLSGYYTILIKIQCTKNIPISVPVAFFVHDSYEFPDDAIYVNPDEKTGEIKLEILGYEAFTIGAYFLDGTQLELDLNDQKGFPKDFYWGKSKKS